MESKAEGDRTSLPPERPAIAIRVAAAMHDASAASSEPAPDAGMKMEAAEPCNSSSRFAAPGLAAEDAPASGPPFPGALSAGMMAGTSGIVSLEKGREEPER